jgi:protein O-GlcNAc transferase
VAEGRLLLFAHEGPHRQRTLAFLARHGVAAERVEFCAHRPLPEYLALYHRIDIGLDTFPYNGHTTSLDSLWMGVPVITLVGQTAVGRAGLSQLTNLGLTELAARTPEEFVERAVALAGDLPHLQALRTGLRARMKQSPLMDAAGYSQSIEQAYRIMWGRWCARQ